MSLSDSISISSIFMGGLIMLYAIFSAKKLYSLIPAAESRSVWKYLIILEMIFFFGYILTIILIINNHQKFLLQLIGLIFLFGAVFVLLAVYSSKKTIVHLLETTVAKEEKEVLLKEIHHRVKNNMQVITSLLSLQASFITDEKVRAMFRYSQYRIHSMAMIHEMLYHSRDLARLEYDQYLKQLAESLIRSMKGTHSNIKLNLDIPSFYLNIDTAIPLGLLVNEILTNALKYGIKGNDEGEINIRLVQNSDKHYTLFIGDNGAGFDDDENFRNAGTLGLQLIHKLTIQLKGSIEKIKGTGTNYIVTFQEIEQTS